MSFNVNSGLKVTIWVSSQCPLNLVENELYVKPDDLASLGFIALCWSLSYKLYIKFNKNCLVIICIKGKQMKLKYSIRN